MATISFACDFSAAPMDPNPPQAGYDFELQGDVSVPTDAELDYIFSQTPSVLLQLQDSSTPHSFKGEIRVKASDRTIVRSAHYTWHVKRADGQPLSPLELSYAFAMQGFSRLEEQRQPNISLPLPTLRCLLEVDRDASGALVAALANAEREGGEVAIDDRKIAASLEKSGLVAATDRPGRYLLLAINVT